MPNILQLLPEIESEELTLIQELAKNFDDAQAQQFASMYRTKRRDSQTVMLLTLIGFVANVAQNEATLSGIRHMMSTIPAAIALLVILITLFYELNDRLEKQIGQELEARKASAS